MPPANDGRSRAARGGGGRRGGNVGRSDGPMGAYNPYAPGAPNGNPYAPYNAAMGGYPAAMGGDLTQGYGAGAQYGVGQDAVAAAAALGMMGGPVGMHGNPMAAGMGGHHGGGLQHMMGQQMGQHPSQLAAMARAYHPAGGNGNFHNATHHGTLNGGRGAGQKFANGGGAKGGFNGGMKSSSQIEDEADEADPPHPRGPPLRTPSGGGLPRPGTGTSTTYARAKHAQLTLKDLAQARDLMVQEIESRGESAQSALKDLVCILKQMGSHAEATATIVRYRAAWPDDDRMQESLDNMLLDLFKHARNLEGQIAVTGQLINYSQKALAEGRTGWMIRTAGCKNTVSVHRRLSTLYRLRGQAQMQSGSWAEAEISLSRALHHERLHVKEEDLSINIDRGACLIATGRLIEAQDLLLHVAAAASQVIDAPHKGVGGSSVGTVRRVGLALKALVELLEKFSGGVRKVARELERTAAVVSGGQGVVDGDGETLGQFEDDDDDLNVAAVDESKLEAAVASEEKERAPRDLTGPEAEGAEGAVDVVEGTTDEKDTSDLSLDGNDENDDKSNQSGLDNQLKPAGDKSTRGHHRREGDSLWMEQVLLPAVDHFWRAGPTARMDLLSLKARQTQRKVELMERDGTLSASEADALASEKVASEAGENEAVAVVTAAMGASTANAGGYASDGDVANPASNSNDSSSQDAQAPAHPILASAAVAQTSATLAAVTTRAAAAAEAGGDAGSVPAGSVPKAGVTSSDDPRAAAQTSAVLAAAAGVPNSAGATAAAAAADPKGIVAAAAAAAADAAAAVTGVGVNPSAVAAMVAGAAADSAGSSAITALLQQEAEKAALVKETRHAHNARVSQAHAHVTAAAAQQQQHQQREAESLSIQYQQQVLIQQQQIQMQQLALEASQNAAAAQLAQAQLAHVSNMQNVEIAKADQRAEFAAQMLREGAPVSDEGADMLASIQQRQQEALARSAGDGMSMFASVRSGNRINLPDVVTDAMMGDTVSDVVLSSGIDFGDDDELKADVKKAAMSTNNNGAGVSTKNAKQNCNTKDNLGQSVGQYVGAHRRDRIPRGEQNPG
jgi:hypothetical protein